MGLRARHRTPAWRPRPRLRRRTHRRARACRRCGGYRALEGDRLAHGAARIAMPQTALPRSAEPAQVDLFGAPQLPGLSSAAHFLSAAEATPLTVRIEAAELAPLRFQTWEVTGLPQSYACHIDLGARA